MKPGSLLRACAQCIAQNLVRTVSHLVVTEIIEKERLICVLACFIELYGDTVYSNAMMQDQLYKTLMAGLRSHHNPPIHFTLMIILCPKVTIDQIAVVEDHNGLPPLVAGTGLDITSEECDAILDIVTRLKNDRVLAKHSTKEGFSLPTLSLVLEGIYFHDPGFLPRILREMPHLLHIELQYNGTPSVLRALSKYCPSLESLSFLEPRMEVSILEKDILPILFGVPASAVHRTSSLICRFGEDEHFRSQFQVQYPNLRKLNLDELYFEEDLLHDVYTLVMVLHPKLTCFGKYTGLTKKMLSKFRRLWAEKNGGSYSNIELFLTKAKFVDSVFDSHSDTEIELKYLESIVSMFKSLKSIEVQKDNLLEKDIGKFCQMFAHQVEAFSLSVLPISHISALNNIKHLRLTFAQRYSFDQVHFILDNCAQLQTLSVHGVLVEHSPHPLPVQNNNVGMLHNDQHILENLLVEELTNQIQDIQAFIEEPQGNNHFHGLNLGAGVRHPPSLRPRSKYKQSKTHLKLTTLRIASLLEAEEQPSEDFLLSLLERLPNLHNLCLGLWMGALSQRREHLTCTGNALVSVITARSADKPLLTELEQLCCLPSGTDSEMCASLVCLADKLPSLQTIVVPALDSFLLSPTLKYFKNSNVEIRHKCATDQVFTHWEPEH
ncbi:uncharacterized protein [Macrobrachium rosenbergii]|uniref:uncharacterized protein n=1 Tax=Macrobrachium rosenbergii TaxID=79674 RepID=UPI0034D78B51